MQSGREATRAGGTLRFRENCGAGQVHRPPSLRTSRSSTSKAGPDYIGTLTGHFAVFSQWTEFNSPFEGRFLEQIAPGAFTKTFNENRAGMRCYSLTARIRRSAPSRLDQFVSWTTTAIVPPTKLISSEPTTSSRSNQAWPLACTARRSASGFSVRRSTTTRRRRLTTRTGSRSARSWSAQFVSSARASSLTYQSAIAALRSPSAGNIRSADELLRARQPWRLGPVTRASDRRRHSR